MNKQSGFTLVEILVAMTVFMVGAVGIMSLLGIAASSHQRAIAYSSASRLAEDLFSYCQSRMMVDDGNNNGLIPAEGGLPQNIPTGGPEAFATSSRYPGFEYKIIFDDINPQSQAGMPGAQPEILAMIYVRWPSEGNDFRVGERDEDDEPNNFEGRIFYSVMLKKPW